MLKALKQLFEQPDEHESLSHDRTLVAACAILLEAGYSDGPLRPDEQSRIVQLMQSEHGLSAEYAQELLEYAEEIRKQSVDLFRFTNTINESCSLEEREKIMEMIWWVIYSDGKLDAQEHYLASRLYKLLRLTHQQMIDTKLKVINQANTKKKSP